MAELAKPRSLAAIACRWTTREARMIQFNTGARRPRPSAPTRFQIHVRSRSPTTHPLWPPRKCEICDFETQREVYNCADGCTPLIGVEAGVTQVRHTAAPHDSRFLAIHSTLPRTYNELYLGTECIPPSPDRATAVSVPRSQLATHALCTFCPRSVSRGPLAAP